MERLDEIITLGNDKAVPDLSTILLCNVGLEIALKQLKTIRLLK
jgi:hypothetical protein